MYNKHREYKIVCLPRRTVCQALWFCNWGIRLHRGKKIVFCQINRSSPLAVSATFQWWISAILGSAFVLCFKIFCSVLSAFVTFSDPRRHPALRNLNLFSKFVPFAVFVIDWKNSLEWARCAFIWIILFFQDPIYPSESRNSRFLFFFFLFYSTSMRGVKVQVYAFLRIL